MAKDSADTFNQNLTSLTDKLNDLDKEISNTSIHSEAEEVKKQLQEHKVITSNTLFTL